MKLFILSIALCFVLEAQGAPTTISRAPCSDRFVQVQIDLQFSSRIIEEPRYIPECESDGVAWKRAQCSHEGEGFCFCVNPETGSPLEGTRSFEESKETINCDEPTEAISLCRQNQQNYRQIPGVAGITAEYYPSCAEDNNFMALQRNSMNFFCVNTLSGEIIPGTTFSQGRRQLLLQENVCQSYSNIWQRYLVWLDSSSEALEASNENGEHTHWASFLQQNADEILRSFWRLGDGEPTEVTGEDSSFEETHMNENSNENFILEETENSETESQEEEDEEFEWEEPETIEEPTTPIEEEPTVNNGEEEYYNYHPYSVDEEGAFDPYFEENGHEEESHQFPTEESSYTEDDHNDSWNEQIESQYNQRIEEEPTQPAIDIEALNRALSETNSEHFDWEEFLRLLNAEEPEQQEVQSEIPTETNNSEYQHIDGENRYLSGDWSENNAQPRQRNYERSETAAFEDSRANLNVKKSSK